ncbi:GNAT family N-acetyltransferase [Shewanella violacea]|uniref:Acetyltransferase, GNAT family n=1 Tax=Shewanella violacea (strain JCM 10179 / CIP 106290 / LMG 19151 / DSS12) TaxID=637905 RepID=D4ZBC2_SHEVD|nr:GNAT family N-acetyltransferase [Shewanella violacea]BAJ03317.1 acetyltransferase, GNAT family [Shewanella violacea DSS12]
MAANCRLLISKDSLNYRELRLESLRLNPDSFGADYEDEVNIPQLHFEKLIEQGSIDALMLGAFVGGKLVGLCGLLASHSGPVIIVQMYVQSGYRGMGVGSRLLYLAKISLSELNHDSLMLTVFEDNQSAINTYTKAGFIATKVEEDEVYMVFHR